MNIGEFVRSADVVALTITIVYCTAYVSHFFVRWRVGNIQEVRKKVIYGIANRFNRKGLMDVINKIIDENPRILMPPTKNILLHTASVLFFISALIAIFYDALVRIAPFILLPINNIECTSPNKNWEKYISNCFSINIDIVYTFFLIFAAISFLLLYWEYKYWHDMNRLKDEHFSSNKIAKIVMEKED